MKKLNLSKLHTHRDLPDYQHYLKDDDFPGNNPLDLGEEYYGELCFEETYVDRREDEPSGKGD